MPTLFEPTAIGRLNLKNRLVRSATYDGMALKSGLVSEAQIGLYRELARGGTGLIVSGIASVHRSGRISAFQNAIDTDVTIAGLRQLVDVVHDHGAKIAVQLFHGGRECGSYQKAKKAVALAPSVVTDDPYCEQDYRQISEEQIGEVIGAFGRAAARAKIAGFDAVQVHGAHAYLPSQFLSPFTNRREDAWGGTFEKRLAFLHGVYRAIRTAVGDGYPVLIKLGVADGFAGGLEFAEGLCAAKACADWGFDAIEVSQGLRGRRYGQTEFRTGIQTLAKEAYFGQWCRQVKAAVAVPVMMVGGLRTPQLIDQILQEGQADFVSLCRPLIREPDLPARWQAGDLKVPACISCNRCFEALLKGIPLHCVVAVQNQTRRMDDPIR